MSFIKDVDRGRLGKNDGLSNGLGSINRYIYNTQRARYYLLGGESGTGKTTLADSMFLFSPYFQMKEAQLEGINLDINWNYYSFEQGIQAKRTSWASKLMYRKYQIRLPGAYLLGKGQNRISDEHYEYCKVIDKELEELFDTINMVDEPIGPNKFATELYKYAAKHGKFIKKPVYDDKGEQKVDKAGKKVYEVTGWVPNNPDAYHIFIMDHIAYAKLELATLKQNIDAISRWCVYFRERCGFTFAIIQQFNTELASIERQKFKKNAIAPQRVDFGDSRYTYQDADVVFGMLNPYAYDMTDFHNYDVRRLEGYGIWSFLMKNRHDGPAGRVSTLFMDPIAGSFTELPNPLTPMQIEIGMLDDPLEEFYERASEFNSSISLYEIK